MLKKRCRSISLPTQTFSREAYLLEHQEAGLGLRMLPRMQQLDGLNSHTRQISKCKG